MTAGAATANHPSVVCTLFEGDYHVGLAALLNSLVGRGFAGQVWAGYRGNPPAWARSFDYLADQSGIKISDNVTLHIEAVDVSDHFANYKPYYMQSLIRRGIAKQLLYYFDPDIVVDCSWSFYERWAGYGVALCEEVVNGTMPADHPLRLSWCEHMSQIGFEKPERLLDRYYNSGFVGLDVTCMQALLDIWEAAIELARESGAKLGGFMLGSREQPFFAVDQDALNIACMYFRGRLSTIGPEGMGFIPGGFTMHHALGPLKPWRKHFIMSAIKGIPPNSNDRRFLECAHGPVRIYSPWTLRQKKISRLIGTLIGRLYRRY